MKTTIHITQDHISLGNEGDCRYCPAALATNEVLKEEFFCEVDGAYITLYGDAYPFPMRHQIETPEEVAEFIRVFDKKPYDPEPITFELDIPEEYLKTP